MRNILFVSVSRIKEKSIFGDSTNEKIITGALLEVQEIELMPLVGNAYYKILQDSIAEKTITDENFKILTDVIEPYLVYGTLVYSVVPLHFKLNNKGANISTDSNLTRPDAKDLESFKNYYKEKFDSYKRKLIEYFKTDEQEETKTSSSEDTTSSVLGFYLPDAKDYSAEYNEARAFKTSYYRRY
ncbi:hypothetical protein [Pedobacter aquatilis]|uniref:DUF6712 family protein n=1 Tax=Pedobacter aquatilis TaxID=351343 RepID=UPI00292D6910|nr:hypothetical protein [Pedobacter aquatilis]